MRLSPNILSLTMLILNAAALSAVVWIIIPAPSSAIWLLSVAASEWSLWFGALALGGTVGAVLLRIFHGKNKIWLATIIVGGAALAIALYPLASALSLARRENVPLSFKRYFSAVWSVEDSAKVIKANAQTYTYARVDGAELKLDVYAPTSESVRNGASLIVVHGGSWNSGGRSDFPQWNRRFAEQGYTVFDVDYRLAQPNYATAVGDIKCAARWIKNRAAEFKISPDRTAILGRSAGAQLALLAAYSADDVRFPSSCEPAESSENFRAVAAFYAPTDLLWAFDNPANESVVNGPLTLGSFLGGSPHESAEMRERYVTASPVARVSSRTPPTLLMHGGYDQLVRVENMSFLAEKLTQANVPHRTILIPYAQHGFDYNSNGFGAQIVEPAILEFLRENLK